MTEKNHPPQRAPAASRRDAETDGIMNGLVMPASIAITAALVLYTIGVFSERRRGTLTSCELLFFWLGLACDTTGTALMAKIAQANAVAGAGDGGHAITGALAIVLMLFHAVWATVVLVRTRRGADARAARSFHRFSTMVWLVWLVPYLTGFLMGMPMLHLGTMPATVASIVVVAIVGMLVLRPHRDGDSQAS